MIKNLLKVCLLIVNKQLSFLGLRLTRTSVPPRSFLEFCEHIKSLGCTPSFIIDVGVGEGTKEIYRSFPDAKYLLVEPLREFEPVLKRLCSKLDAKYVIAAATDRPGTIELNVHDDPQGSSILGEVEGALADGRLRQVAAVCLDDLFPQDVVGTVLLKIDVQGAELAVLNGIKNNFDKIDLIILEASLISSMHGGPEIGNIIEFMKSRGFAVYDVIGGFFRPLDGCLKQVDLVFVPEDSTLRQDRRYATVEQRQRLNAAARKRLFSARPDV